MAGVDMSEFDETRRLAEASAWRVALFEAELESTEDFESWLAADDGNALAWRQVSASWDRFGREAMEPELIIARRDVLERVRRQKERRFAEGKRWNSPGVRIAAALIVIAILGLATGLGIWQATKSDVYQTALGERRTITLADGSHISLDADTLLKVRLRPRARKIELIRGQARFEVAHDTTRPFTVHAGDKTVVATGTSFNVDLFGTDVIVTLIEGRVSVLEERRPPLPVIGKRPTSPVVVARLTPGEQLIAPQTGLIRVDAPVLTLKVEKVGLDQATAWETGQLVFDNEPLSSVVRRISRYSSRPVVVDKTVGALRLSGVFDAGDLPAFLGAVQRALPVTAETGEDGVVRLQSREPLSAS
jgi:transmembrane sensor